MEESAPSRNGEGQRLTNHPLALNLHYLVTAYGKDELNGEILLGRTMQILHETPVPTRQAVRIVGKSLLFRFTHGGRSCRPSGIDQDHPAIIKQRRSLEAVDGLSSEYRPSADTCLGGVDRVHGSGEDALPVLKRGKEDRGVKATIGGLPFIETVRFDRGKPAAELGAAITVAGNRSSETRLKRSCLIND
jgi:hypothetical protein